MLQSVDQACRVDADHRHGTVVIESDIKQFPLAIEELQSVEARNLALGTAASKFGISDPRINGNPGGAYPINGEGYSLDQVKDDQGNSLPPNSPKMQIARYRIDIPVCSRLV